MTHKSDFSTLPSASMSYSRTARPHALTSLNTGSATRTFAYNANGAITGGQVTNGATPAGVHVVRPAGFRHDRHDLAHVLLWARSGAVSPGDGHDDRRPLRPSAQVQNFAYGYDSIGNVSGRADLINSVSEAFGYDALDR